MTESERILQQMRAGKSVSTMTRQDIEWEDNMRFQRDSMRRNQEQMLLQSMMMHASQNRPPQSPKD